MSSVPLAPAARIPPWLFADRDRRHRNVGEEARLDGKVRDPLSAFARLFGEALRDDGASLDLRDRSAGDDPRAAGIEIRHCGVAVGIEPVAEIGFDDLERRRVPAILLE